MRFFLPEEIPWLVFIIPFIICELIWALYCFKKPSEKIITIPILDQQEGKRSLGLTKRRSTIHTEAKLTNKRADGNTTRQIDVAIQLLFQGYIVRVEDHYKNGTDKKANCLLFVKIRDRFDCEHQR